MNEVKRILNYWKELNLLTSKEVTANVSFIEFNKKYQKLQVKINEKIKELDKENKNEYFVKLFKSKEYKAKERYLNQKSLVSCKKLDDVKSLFSIIDKYNGEIETFNSLKKEKKEEKKEKCDIEIGFGNIKNTFLYERIGINDDIIDGDGGSSFIFSFLTDSNRKYKEHTFEISRFVYNVLTGIYSEKYEEIEKKLSDFNEKIDEKLQEYDILGDEELGDFVCHLKKELNISDISERDLKENFFIKVQKDDESSYFQNDFYTEDLEKIEKNITENSFLSDIIYPKLDRKDCYKVDDDIDFLKEVTLPKNMPLGKWPSKYNPSLMQDVAINICTSEEYIPNVFSVNGPPGTGKTTLLKEIIADTIVKKAEIISNLELTDIKKVKNKNIKAFDQYSKIPDELKKLGIIVASNNNSAVENISKDLPKAKDVSKESTLTGLFDVSDNKDIYFTIDSDNLFKNKKSKDEKQVKDCENWGLISAPYGKTANIKRILEILPNKGSVFSNEKKSDKKFFKFKVNDIQDFENVKKEFLEKYNKVVNYRKMLNDDVENLKDSKLRIDEFLNKYLCKDDSSSLKNQWKNCLNDDFYDDIVNNEDSQSICPWSVNEFNVLREELFESSLQLIKTFILNSPGIKQNLRIYKQFLNKESLGYSVEEKKEAMKECFHTLNLLIPVLSTTFAAVSRAFKNFDENELGLVIIDEAGQATPFSAMGLLYRANRCIIVGDPLQVEPVMTTSPTLIRTTANKYGINEIEKEFKIANDIYNYMSPNLSIQTLADAANKYYGKIGETEVGCPLVVHRRCLSPMFDISNEISYDNRMIKCTFGKKENCVLKNDEFLDVKGKEKGNKNHYVEEQGDKVVEIIKKYMENNENNIFEDNKKLYVISPFTSVISELRKRIKNEFKENASVKTWCSNCLGTVHKFQGKEADSVILLLGCDNTSKAAANWASSSANILNVAATRAKKRFVIIGDLDLWGNLKFFENAKNILNK